MVHNGIEYGLMEIIAETYDLMKRGMGLTDEDLETIYTQWAAGDTNSYLLEITARIFAEVDQKTGRKLINVILDEAKQKGTGKWTSQSAMDLQIPVPTIDAAVAMRDLSAFKEVRGAVSKIYENKIGRVREGRDTFLPRLRNAYYSAALITYAQGMALLRTASQTYAYHLDLEEIARIWRGGCIIRAAVLEDLRAAYRTNSDLANLLLDPELSARLKERVKDLRLVVQEAAFTGVPAPALAASLAYFDGYRSAWLPANLIQAQRDYFGAHTYERTDEKGIFHTVWEKG
jgi:6-phosphogluconate dehydrogenase